MVPELTAASTPESCAEQFRRHGCLLVRDLLPRELVSQLGEVYCERYARYFDEDRPGDALKVGSRRFMVTLEMEMPFLDAALYANPLVLPVLQQLLGSDLVLGSFASVTSLPGAKDQHLHRDNPLLFGPVLNRFLPPHAVNLFIPLREFNATNGTTRLMPGSHLKPDEEGKATPGLDPTVPLGCGLLVDYRLFHHGTANLSDQPRPMLYCVYHRPWFKDYQNYRQQPFMKISPERLAAIPEEHRGLFRWLKHYDTGLF